MSIAFPWNWERWSSTEKAAAPAPRSLPSHNDKMLRLVAVPTIQYGTAGSPDNRIYVDHSR
jgi:hypothetical protein